VSYSHLPYAFRYLVVLLAWVGLLMLALAFKMLLIFMIPILLIWSKGGLQQTQQTAQATATMGDLFVYGWPRFPRANWRRLLGGRRRSADKTAKPGTVHKVGNRSI